MTTCSRCSARVPGSSITRYRSNPRRDGTYAVDLAMCPDCSEELERLR